MSTYPGDTALHVIPDPAVSNATTLKHITTLAKCTIKSYSNIAAITKLKVHYTAIQSSKTINKKVEENYTSRFIAFNIASLLMTLLEST